MSAGWYLSIKQMQPHLVYKWVPLVSNSCPSSLWMDFWWISRTCS